jgi:hypothetical protein
MNVYDSTTVNDLYKSIHNLVSYILHMYLFEHPPLRPDQTPSLLEPRQLEIRAMDPQV